jgi:hypothetical protein
MMPKEKYFQWMMKKTSWRWLELTSQKRYQAYCAETGERSVAFAGLGKKLGSASKLIETVRGVAYRFTEG